MNDRFKFRLIIEKPYKTVNGNLKGQLIQYCNGFIQTKTKTYFFGNNKRISILNSQIKAINQCTGLKDKNGKLIFEGDIVNYDDRDLDPWHTPILNAVIEMRKYQWCMVYYRKDIINADTRKPAEQKTWLGFDDFISSRIEVIGNIYENKSLLESEE